MDVDNVDRCSACQVDYYHNPDVRMLFSKVCSHPVCEPCVMRLFQHVRTYPCPLCSQSVRAEDFSEQSNESRVVESATKIRRQICDVYCKTEEDFSSADEFNDYLEQREDLIYRLLNPSSQEDVRDVWRHIDEYKERNAFQIMQAQSQRPRKKLQRIWNIIEEEGVFCSQLNAEWAEQLAAPGSGRAVPTPADGNPTGNGSGVLHAFRSRYGEFLEKISTPVKNQERSAEETAGASAESFQPSPLCGGHGPASLARHMSGGGRAPDTCFKKARYFFLADVVKAASAGSTAA